MKIEFVEYEKVENEKYLGIATVNFDDRVYLRFKVANGKNGGLWFQPASYKVGDKYVSCFEIDSTAVRKSVDDCIRNGIKSQIGSINDHPDYIPF